MSATREWLDFADLNFILPKFSENDKILPIMYWIPKMHKSHMGHRFIIASKVVVQKRFLNHCQVHSNLFLVK